MDSGYNIEDVKQIEILSSAVRGEILDIIEFFGKLSIREISEHTGRSQHSLYHHIKMLHEVELIYESETRKVNGQIESIYDVPGRPMRLKYDSEDTSVTSKILSIIRGIVSTNMRDFQRAFDNFLIHRHKNLHNVTHTREIGWLSDEEVYEFQMKMRRLLLEFKVRDKPVCEAKRKLYTLSVLLVPKKQSKIEA